MKNLLPTPSTSVETAKTKKGGTWRKFLTACALFGALALPLKASTQGQISPEKKDSIECVVPTQTQKQDSSTISYDEAKQTLNGEKREISTEEIQEYIQNNREEFEEYIKNNGEELNKIIDKQTMDILYEQLANNEDVKSMINEMINRDDIRDAVIKGNTEYIQEQIKNELEYYKNGFYCLLFMIGIVIFSMILTKILFKILLSIFDKIDTEDTNNTNDTNDTY